MQIIANTKPFTGTQSTTIKCTILLCATRKWCEQRIMNWGSVSFGRRTFAADTIPFQREFIRWSFIHANVNNGPNEWCNANILMMHLAQKSTIFRSLRFFPLIFFVFFALFLFELKKCTFVIGIKSGELYNHFAEILSSTMNRTTTITLVWHIIDSDHLHFSGENFRVGEINIPNENVRFCGCSTFPFGQMRCEWFKYERF